MSHLSINGDMMAYMQYKACAEVFLGRVDINRTFTIQREAALVSPVTINASFEQSIGTSAQGAYRCAGAPSFPQLPSAFVN